MGLPTVVQNAANTFNSLGRSRKIILIVLFVLGFLYFMGPYIFRMRSPSSAQIDPTEECLAHNLAEFQAKVGNLDMFISGDFDDTAASKQLAYVGNGNIAAALGSDNGLYIRIYRALSQPLKYWPVVQTHLTGLVKESSVLNVRSGLAHKVQVKATSAGCVSIHTQLYAHRSRPALLVQDVLIQNPSPNAVVVELDQIGASGWDDVEMQRVSYTPRSGEKVDYKVFSGTVAVTNSNTKIAVAVAAVSIASKEVTVEAASTKRFHFLTAVYYSRPFPAQNAHKYVPDCIEQAKGELEKGLEINENVLKLEHTKVWGKLWFSGFSISTSLAAGALNGDRINKTLYYVLSNSPAPLHNVMSTVDDKLKIERILHFPDSCYEGHSTLVSGTLWIDPQDEAQVARVVTTWMITLEKQGCVHMVQAGAEGILQAMILSLGPLHFHKQHLEMTSHPRDLHRDLHFRRINYGNNTHVNISVVVGDDNKATLFVALDRNDKPYYGCDAGCLDPPIPLSKEQHQFPVKLTDPVTSVLYITSDKQHMEELKHAIHVKEIIEAPAHEHHVIALHKHGHHFGGLPTIFWVSIAFLIIIFHLFLFKLIYNEYCQGYDKLSRSHYNL
ncbi:hypothetical protein BsWGS_18922 [Bradybaena similaris]